jgi:hypothetical protein
VKQDGLNWTGDVWVDPDLEAEHDGREPDDDEDGRVLAKG